MKNLVHLSPFAHSAAESFMDKFKTLTIFMETAQNESFAAAANRLNISPSTVSKAISRLEEYLSVKLFERSSRALHLTPEGQIYYDRHCEILEKMHQIDTTLRQTDTIPKGKLRLSLVPEFSQRYIIPKLQQFRQTFPDIQLNISLSTHLVDPVRDRFDATLRAGFIEDDRLIYHPIAQSQRITCASPTYLQNHGYPTHISDLNAHQCLYFSYPHSQEIQAWQFESTSNTEHQAEYQTEPAITFDNFEPLVQAAIENCGIIQAPDYLVQPAITEKRLIPVLQAQTSKKLTPLSFVFTKKQAQSSTLGTWIKFIESIVAPLHQQGILSG